MKKSVDLPMGLAAPGLGSELEAAEYAGERSGDKDRGLGDGDVGLSSPLGDSGEGVLSPGTMPSMGLRASWLSERPEMESRCIRGMARASTDLARATTGDRRLMLGSECDDCEGDTFSSGRCTSGRDSRTHTQGS